MKALDHHEDSRQPVTHGRLTVVAEEDDDEVFVHLEAVTLLHQLAEAAWPMLFAAGPDVRSPSLFLAQLRTQDFVGRLKDAQADPDRFDKLLRHVLLLDDLTEPDADDSDGKLGERHVGPARRIMLLAADRLIVDRRIHNAIKHGFAITTPRALLGFAFDDPRLQPDADPDLELGRSAIWLSVLEQRSEKDPDGRRPWTRTFTALDDLDQEFWLIELLSRLLDAFWSLRRRASGSRRAGRGRPA